MTKNKKTKAKGIHGIDINEVMRDFLDESDLTSSENDDEVNVLQGDVCIEPHQEQGSVATEPVITKGPPVPIFPIPKDKKKRIVFKECPIAGWNFHDPEDFWEELHEGAEVALVRDKRNKHDRNAVAVALPGDYDGNPDDFDFDFIIGYVPRSENKFISEMMDLGWSDAFTAELTTVKDYGPYSDRLRMTIYLQSKEEENYDDDETRTFAQFMDEESFADIQESLYNKGYAYFRWPYGLPGDFHELPDEGDKVLFIHEQGKDTKLYLMYVVAKDEHVSTYLKNDEESEMIDDCIPFVLTNIKGPVTCDTDEFHIFEDDETDPIPPGGLISAFAAKCLKEILKY